MDDIKRSSMATLASIPIEILLYEIGRRLEARELSSFFSALRALHQRRGDLRFWQLWLHRYKDDKLDALVLEGAAHNSLLLISSVELVNRLIDVDYYTLQLAYYTYGEKKNEEAMEIIRTHDTSGLYPYIPFSQIQKFYSLLDEIKDELRAVKSNCEPEQPSHDDSEEKKPPPPLMRKIGDLYFLINLSDNRFTATIAFNHYLGRTIGEFLTEDHLELLNAFRCDDDLHDDFIIESLVHGILYHYQKDKISIRFPLLRSLSRWEDYREQLVAQSDRRLINQLGASGVTYSSLRFSDKKLWIRSWNMRSEEYYTHNDLCILITSHLVLQPEETIEYVRKLRISTTVPHRRFSADNTLTLSNLDEKIIEDALHYGKRRWARRYEALIKKK